MTYILDACALIALLKEEIGKGYEQVKDLLDRAATGEITLCMSLVNLVEVYYRIIQIKGIENADTVMEPVKSLPIRSYFPLPFVVYLQQSLWNFGRYHLTTLNDAFDSLIYIS